MTKTSNNVTKYWFVLLSFRSRCVYHNHISVYRRIAKIILLVYAKMSEI